MHSHLKTAQWLSHLLDNQFKFGPISFGLDPIIGLFPVMGTVFTSLLSVYIVWIGIEMRIPGEKIAEMIGNIVLDFLLSFIPVLGQLADFAFKSNVRNLKIINQYVKEDVMDGEVIH